MKQLLIVLLYRYRVVLNPELGGVVGNIQAIIARIQVQSNQACNNFICVVFPYFNRSIFIS